MVPGRPRRRSALALVGLALAGVLVVSASRSPALGANDVAGTLNGEPVTLGEVDEALGGSIRRQWAEMHTVARAAAEALCGERAVAQLVAEAGRDAEAWRAEIWTAARPTGSEVSVYVGAHPEIFDGADYDTRMVAHRLRVTRFRDEIARRTAEKLAKSLVVHLPELSDPPDAEPKLPASVASCLGESVTAADVERMSAFPLYRRRAAVVSSTCRQFDIDYSNPLVLHRMAKAQGVSVEEFRKGVDGSFEELSDRDVEASALEHYGSREPAALFRARIALEAQRRLPGRMALLEGIKQNTLGACALEPPAAPNVHVRGNGSARGPADGLPVVLFANFRCRHCPASFEILERLEARFEGRVRIEFRHHFPDTFLPTFEDALAAACSGDLGQLFEYAQARTSGRIASDSAPKLSDAGDSDFEACLRDPRMAVRVLNDTQEALRLGFRDAVPSWVVGQRPRKGFQGEAILIETLEEQLGAGAGPRASL